MIHVLDEQLAFPDPQDANQDGLLAIGGDLQEKRLLLAYENGIFPWYSEGEPILWFSPDPRLILRPTQFKASASLARKRSSGSFETKFDSAFSEVIQRCSAIKREKQTGTWITRDMITAYEKLHEIGHAHSVETYSEGKLVGGLYGLSIGRAFFGESMFHEVSDASKLALWALSQRLAKWNFDLIDCQMTTAHLLTLGAQEMPRAEFLKLVRESVVKKAPPSNWRMAPPTA
jgi:leucyl/phenylalanyl-tRNA---protein transferase